jgi:hypothetical protein
LEETNAGAITRHFPGSDKDEFYKQIGQLKVELVFLKLKKRAGLID